MNKLICYATGGLGNRIFPLASAIEYAKSSNRKLYLYWPKDIRMNAEFTDLYDEEITIVDDAFLNNLKDDETRYYIRHQDSADNDLNLYKRGFLTSKQSTSPEIGQDPEAPTVKNLVFSSNTFLNEVPLDTCKERVRQLKIKAHIRESIDTLANQLGLDKTVLGMHLRGTDFPPPVGWLEWLGDKIAVEDSKIFVCSDDLGLELRAFSAFLGRVIFREGKKYVSRLDTSNPAWQNNVYASKDSLVDSLKDLYLLGKTKLSYYNNVSTFGAYAKILSE